MSYAPSWQPPPGLLHGHRCAAQHERMARGWCPSCGGGRAYSRCTAPSTQAWHVLCTSLLARGPRVVASLAAPANSLCRASMHGSPRAAQQLHRAPVWPRPVPRSAANAPQWRQRPHDCYKCGGGGPSCCGGAPSCAGGAPSAGAGSASICCSYPCAPGKCLLICRWRTARKSLPLAQQGVIFL